MTTAVKKRSCIYQCKNCNYILSDSVQATDDDDSSEGRSGSSLVKGTTHHARIRRQGKDTNFLLQCGGCPLIVGSCDSQEAGVYQLQRDQVIRSYINNEKVEKLEVKVNDQEARIVQQEARIVQQEARIVGQGARIVQQEARIVQQEERIVEQEAKIVELGIQAIQNRFDIIHLKHIITKIHLDPQIKEELEKGIDPEIILGLQNPQ